MSPFYFPLTIFFFTNFVFLIINPISLLGFFVLSLDTYMVGDFFFCGIFFAVSNSISLLGFVWDLFIYLVIFLGFHFYFSPRIYSHRMCFFLLFFPLRIYLFYFSFRIFFSFPLGISFFSISLFSLFLATPTYLYSQPFFHHLFCFPLRSSISLQYFFLQTTIYFYFTSRNFFWKWQFTHAMSLYSISLLEFLFLYFVFLIISPNSLLDLGG